MGTLRDGQFEIVLDDESLVHLDAALGILGSRGIVPRIHTYRDEATIHSFSGASVILEYENSPKIVLDTGLLDTVIATAESGRALSMPFLALPFKG